jgi:dihydrofolate reductase
MIISFVVAASENNVIGKDNKLLWTLPNDMKFFKNTTWGMPVIMGRKTYDSLGKPLEGRSNIVITRQKIEIPGVKVVNNLDQALAAAAETDAKESFIIGGGQVFAEAMPRANKIYITRVHTVIEGDTQFPVIDELQWQLISNLDFPADAKHKYAYSFQLWQRKKS